MYNEQENVLYNETVTIRENEEKIYSEELEKLIIQEIYDELSRIYTIKDVALSHLIEQKLIMQEAKKQNPTSDSYLNNYIENSFMDLHQYGIYATPTIVINSRLLFNSGSYKEISKLLDIELDK